MDRDWKRLTKRRTAALLATVVVHALIIIWALSIKPFSTQAIPTQAIQVSVVQKMQRSRANEKLSPLQMTELKPVLLAVAVPFLQIPSEPPPPQALASEETSESNVSVVASNGAPSTSSHGSGAASTGEGEDITAAHRVQPIYPDASIKAREQGYVVVGLLIDEHGRVRKTKVAQSSGFSRLDQSAVDALRQWTFTRAGGATHEPTWTAFRYGFHLASPSGLDLSAITLALLPYDPALAEQIWAAALPIVATKTPKPHGAAALRKLIAAIQTVSPSLGRDLQGSQAPVQLVIKLGAVKSIRFLGFESHGLEVDSVAHGSAADPQHPQDSEWELYKVTQNGGSSEWLLEVTRSGVINTAQALTCQSEQTAIDCPWPNLAPIPEPQ